MLFTGSRNVPEGQAFALLEAQGGRAGPDPNGTTSMATLDDALNQANPDRQLSRVRPDGTGPRAADATVLVYDLPLDYYASFRERIAAVTPQHVAAVAAPVSSLTPSPSWSPVISPPSKDPSVRSASALSRSWN